jgi:membrane-associated phospholipid phosphatase
MGAATSRVLGPLATLCRDGARVYAPRRLPWHLVAFALTFVLVTSGFDWTVVTTFRGTQVQRLAYSAASVGFFTPIVVPFLLLLVGAPRRDGRAWSSAWRLVESEVLALVICAAHTAITGRPGPTQSADDTSHVFRFGFLEGGLFWGWPSSHVMVAVAGAVAMAVLHRGNRVVRWIALAYAAYMTVCVGITFHWCSDAVAGAIIGTVIGVVVGTSGTAAAPREA